LLEPKASAQELRCYADRFAFEEFRIRDLLLMEVPGLVGRRLVIQESRRGKLGFEAIEDVFEARYPVAGHGSPACGDHEVIPPGTFAVTIEAVFR